MAVDVTVNYVELGTLVGLVWNDVDGDGVFDPGESGIGGVTVVVTGDPDGDGTPSVITTVVTGSDGTYNVDLPPGTWTVTVDPTTFPPGLEPTTPLTSTATVVAGETTNVETGVAGGTVTGRIWFDTDGDGRIDESENDISGVVVDVVCPGADGVIGTADDVSRSTTTRSPFTISDLPLGQNCRLTIDPTTLPEGVTATFDPDGTLDGSTTVAVAEPGGTQTVNFGYTGPDLPRTGNSGFDVLRYAGGFFLIGLGLLLATRRRRRPHAASTA